MNLSGVRDELRDYLFVKDVQFASGMGLKSRFALNVWLGKRSSRIDNELPWGTLKGEAKCCVLKPWSLSTETGGTRILAGGPIHWLLEL